ncbi:helix-turn-helix domain-containing protein [Nonomuraea spiralis]|uniref:Helix-turn-helix domain-containing protein n=1 Tax=Nonomuraea spiralis TaxID=46182 RepID=A0ABV5I685_9ACTN
MQQDKPGRELRALRLARDLTIAQAARTSGCASGEVFRVENGLTLGRPRFPGWPRCSSMSVSDRQETPDAQAGHHAGARSRSGRSGSWRLRGGIRFEGASSGSEG